MSLFIYFLIILVVTFLPMLGLVGNVHLFEKYNIDGMLEAYCISNVIIYTGIFLAFIKIKKFKFKWTNLIICQNSGECLEKILKYCWIFCIIQFILRGYDIFRGVDRGSVRTSMGIFGPLSTFIGNFGVPTLLSMATVIFLFFTKNYRSAKKSYIKIVIVSILVSLMAGGKANVLFMMMPAVLQGASKINIKSLLVIGIAGLGSVVIIGTRQMNMSVNESMQYNMVRSTTMATMGSVGVWNEYKDSCPEAWYSLFLGFGDHIIRTATNLSPSSSEYLKFNLPRKITYYYYPNKNGALDGTVNLTITAFGEAVYWGGHKYYFLISIIFALLLYKITLMVFKTRTYKKFKLNILYTTFFTGICVPWLNSTSGSFISQWFGFTTLVYLLFTWMLIQTIASGMVWKLNNLE